MNEYEVRAADALSRIRCEALGNKQDVDLVALLSRQCGWNPLVVGEMMTVHFNGREYEIVRKA